ncbi:MAG: PhoH family protein [Gammaproteobacteria bacterium]|nr:MAG: PhoH family protein [Gammaproteobacteria bacterium]
MEPIRTFSGHFVQARNLTQVEFFDSLEKNDVIFYLGPAGTGKTFAAIAAAVSLLRDKKIRKIVLTRPAVEAGEKLGFLPGTYEEKLDPYLRPLYDALDYLLGAVRRQELIEQNIIEIAPLAYMRGRTLEKAFIVLDEAQNCTYNQLKLLLTRLGKQSKCVITGDPGQSDIKNQSALITAHHIFGNIPGIKLIQSTEEDVVRHNLVRRILRAYDNFESRA